MTIFISAGEASGEHYGALLVAELRRQLAAQGREAECFGMGGARMRDAGMECVVPAEEMAVMGLTEVLRHLPRIWRELNRLKEQIRQRRPAVAILIDFPDLHFRIAAECHRLGVPVIFFVSPQLWAWKKHRIQLVQRYVDRMLVIFPFEEPYYRERGVQAEFVGHPLAELPLPSVRREEFATAHCLDPKKTWIGLLPGSRGKEIRSILPEMLAAADRLSVRQPENSREFLLPLAPTLTEAQRGEIRTLIADRAVGLPVHLVDDARAVLHHARASIIASGTATLEAALIGNPFVVVYRVSPLTFAIAKRLVQVKYVSMANLIAGKLIVPELLQNDFTAENILRHLVPLLEETPERQNMLQELERVRNLLHAARTETGAIGRVAQVAIELIEAKSTEAS